MKTKSPGSIKLHSIERSLLMLIGVLLLIILGIAIPKIINSSEICRWRSLRFAESHSVRSQEWLAIASHSSIDK